MQKGRVLATLLQRGLRRQAPALLRCSPGHNQEARAPQPLLQTSTSRPQLHIGTYWLLFSQFPCFITESKCTCTA
jgi:hypothetical protein